MVKTGHKSENFWDIKKPLSILLDNLIKNSVQNFKSVERKCVTYAVSRFEEHGFKKDTS